MRAWSVLRLGEPRDALRATSDPVPRADHGQILVHVRATALNFPDVLLCRGAYQVRPELPFTPGFEICGDVVGATSLPAGMRVGDRVIGRASLPHGGLAEYALTDAKSTLLAPAGLDDAEAASLHVAYQTAWFALRRRAQLHAGEVLLVHAAAGGVGSAAVQIGKAMGATVVATVGSSGKTPVVQALGADLVIDRSTADFASTVQEFTSGQGANVVFDPIGGDVYARSTKCISFEGRIVVVGFASGEVPVARLNHPLLKNYSIVGLHWGLYEDRNSPHVHECHAELSELVAQGRVHPLVSDRIGFSEVPGALEALAAGGTTGRVVWVRGRD